jgi:hypothetical protein
MRRQSRAQLDLEMKPRSIRHLLFVTTHTPAVCAILITFAVGTSLPFVREQRGRRVGLSRCDRTPMEQPQSTAKTGPDPPWGVGGYIGPGPCSLGWSKHGLGPIENVKIDARVKRPPRWRPLSVVGPTCGRRGR